MKFISSAFLIFLFTSLSLATELRLTRAQALAQGFFPQTISKKSTTTRDDLAAHSLAWPVKFIDAKHSIGNSMPEYQNYSNEAYYHAGADLRLQQSGQVVAPTDGFIQGNYYTYVTDPNTGEDKKFTKPITNGGDPLYFEITLKTADNLFLEFHHVNPDNLPKAIYELVLRGGGNVQRGEILGTAAVWPVSRFGERYDHIHYNLISANGVYLNPEYYSHAFIDNLAPVIKNIFAVYRDKKVEVLNQKLNALPTELIVSAIDIKGENIYPLPPTLVEATWSVLGSESQKVGWDFTQKLLNSLGLFPDIREVYA
ncbi:MAG: hypothetical protein AABY53_05985, partial [Bdellovibrionota bacterium]